MKKPSIRRHRAWPLFLSAALAALPGAPALGAPAHTRYVPQTVTLSWLRISPTDARTIYLGGTFPNQGDGSDQWVMRSTDGGTGWIDLTDPLGLYNTMLCPGVDCGSGIDALQPAADGKHLYATGGSSFGSPASSSSYIVTSTDGGLRWGGTDAGAQDACGDTQYGGGPSTLTVSPLSATRVYALVQCGGGALPEDLETSSDGGRTWRHSAKSPASVGPLDPKYVSPLSTLHDVVADPTRLDTLYVNLDQPEAAARSDDGGLTWTAVMTPTATPALTGFRVSTDPHEPGMLVARTDDSGHPADLIFLSGDQGRTWQQAYCPGDLQGKCPTYTVDNVFGAGHSYAFFPDGVHAFDGGGPAGPRLSLSDQLPIAFASILDVQAGTHGGDPVYLLGKGDNGHVQGVLYRSTDAGRSWQLLPAGLFPNVLPPQNAPGSLAVPHAQHRVAAPFVATYRRLGTFLLGLPITEAYREGDVLTQDFEHMRLEVQAGKVVIANLGAQINWVENGDDENCDKCVARVPNTATVRYFGDKYGHTIRGDFLRFWQQHGGLAVFGAPITEAYRGANGDGSHHLYTMQLFANARLELHPEVHDPRYRIELGLIGDQMLVHRGWLRAQ